RVEHHPDLHRLVPRAGRRISQRSRLSSMSDAAASFARAQAGPTRAMHSGSSDLHLRALASRTSHGYRLGILPGVLPVTDTTAPSPRPALETTTYVVIFAASLCHMLNDIIQSLL